MVIYWKYFWLVVRHKWFVLLCVRKAGFGMLGRLLFHDMSKFLPDEFIPYARYWENKPEDRTDEIKKAYKKASEIHEKRNKHHHEYWFKEFGQGDTHPYLIPMDWDSISELFCDWRAAGLAYNGVDDSREYFIREGPRMSLHPETRAEIEFFYEVVWNTNKGIYQQWSEQTFEDFE